MGFDTFKEHYRGYDIVKYYGPTLDSGLRKCSVYRNDDFRAQFYGFDSDKQARDFVDSKVQEVPQDV
jgi:hypothetical protein